MKSNLVVGAQAMLVCALLGAGPAAATTIDIGLAEAPGTDNITTVASGDGATGVGWVGSYDGYILNAVFASDPDPIDFASGTIDVSGRKVTAPIYLYVTETGLTSPEAALDFSSVFGIANLPTGWTLTETTYLDTSNTAYGTGTPLGSMSASGKTVNTTQTVTTSGTVGSTFSMTEVYEIFSQGLAGILGASEQITAAPSSIMAAPAPSIGSGVPAMLAVGGILLGWKLLERRRQS